MKQSRIILFLGIWFAILPILGIPNHIKKLLIIIPGLFLIAMGITLIRSEKNKKDSSFSNNQEELIHEIAEEITEDIIQEANYTTQQEVKKLRDIL